MTTPRTWAKNDLVTHDLLNAEVRDRFIGMDSSVGGFVGTPGSATDAALRGIYIAPWKASTVYTAGQYAISPSGDVISAKVAFTSGTTFNISNWNLSTTFAPASGSTAYAPATGSAVYETAAHAAATYSLPSGGVAYNLLYRDGSNVSGWTTSQASVARALGWIVATDPAYGVVADWAGGNTGTDNTTALQAALNAGPMVWLPPGYYRYTGNLALGQHSQFMGAGWSALAQESYGDPLWTSATGYTRYKGTVLYCSATTGNAITGDNAVGGRWRLNGFMLIGPGTGTSNGVSICQTLSFNIRPNLRDVGVFNFGGTGWLIGGTNEGQFDSLTSYACATGFNFGPNFNANSVTNIECQRSTVDGIVVSGYGNSFHGGIVQNTAGNTGLHVATNSPGNTFTRFYAENSSCTTAVIFESETKFSGKFASNILTMQVNASGCVLDHVYAPSTVLTFGTNLTKNVLNRCSFASVARNGSDILDNGSRVGGTSSPIVGIGNDTPWQFERTDVEASLRLKDNVNSHYIADFYPAATDATSLVQFHSLIGSGSSATGSRPNAGNFAASVRWYDSTVHKPIWGDGTTFRDARGYITIIQTKTANYTHVDGDEIVVYNGTSLTATLPDPTTVVPGRRWVTKNINASALTVVSAGTSKLLDGAPSQAVAQWAKVAWVSDSTQWISV